MSSPSPLDSQLESAVYESLRRQLDPEVIEEPAGLARELDRRDALFGVAGRFALAIGVSAVVAVFFVFMIPASRQPDAAASLSSTIEQMKAALMLSQPAQQAQPPQPAQPLQVTPPPQREDANANGNSGATTVNTTATAGVNLPDVQTVRPSSETNPPVGHEQSEKLLQQFMKWQQKPAQ